MTVISRGISLLSTLSDGRIVGVITPHPEATYGAGHPFLAVLDLKAWAGWPGRDPREAVLLHAMPLTDNPGHHRHGISEVGAVTRDGALTVTPIVLDPDTIVRIRADTDPTAALLRHPLTRAALAGAGRGQADIAAVQPTPYRLCIRIAETAETDLLALPCPRRFVQQQKAFQNGYVLGLTCKAIRGYCPPADTGLRMLGKPTGPLRGSMGRHRQILTMRAGMLAGLDRLLEDGQIIGDNALRAARWAAVVTALEATRPAAVSRGTPFDPSPFLEKVFSALLGLKASCGWHGCARRDHIWTPHRWRRGAARGMLALEVARASRSGARLMHRMAAGSAACAPAVFATLERGGEDGESMATRVMDIVAPSGGPRISPQGQEATSGHTRLQAAREAAHWQALARAGMAQECARGA